MKFINKAALRGSTSVCAALAALTVFSAPAFAQDDTPAVNTPAECADADADGVCDSDVGGAIVVTGSRIRTPNATSSLPITSIVGETFIAQGGNSIGDNLNYRHFLNITRVVRPLAPENVHEPSEDELFGAYRARHGV